METIARANAILIPVPVLGELRVGFKSGTKEKKNLEELDEFLSSPRVSTPEMSEQTALFYSEIFSALKGKGTPIPINDIWIAACTEESGAVLVSGDTHFKLISGLVIYEV